jgi:hypothetical protein
MILAGYANTILVAALVLASYVSSFRIRPE